MTEDDNQMIHWGGEVLQGQRPDSLSPSDDTSHPPIKAMSATILHASNDVQMKKSPSLTEYLSSLPEPPTCSTSSCGRTSLLAAPWQLRYDRIHHPIDGDKVRGSMLDTLNSFVPLFRERAKVRKNSDLLVPSKKEASALLVINGPSIVKKGQLFSMQLIISNTLNKSYEVALYFRLDCGKHKIEVARKDVTLDPGKSAEVSIKIASDSIWTEKLAGTEPNFTAIGTAHIKDSGELMSKLSHVMIKWQRASALSQIFTRRNSKTPVFPGGSHEH